MRPRNCCPHGELDELQQIENGQKMKLIKAETLDAGG
jgi:hypothetical protein